MRRRGPLEVSDPPHCTKGPALKLNCVGVVSSCWVFYISKGKDSPSHHLTTATERTKLDGRHGKAGSSNKKQDHTKKREVQNLAPDLVAWFPEAQLCPHCSAWAASQLNLFARQYKPRQICPQSNNFSITFVMPCSTQQRCTSWGSSWVFLSRVHIYYFKNHLIFPSEQKGQM